MHAAFELLRLPANAAPRLPRFNAAVSIILHVYVNDLLLLRSGICFVVPPPPEIWVCRYSSHKGVADRICTCRMWPFGAPVLGTVSASEAGLKLPWNQRSGTADVRRFMLDISKGEVELNRPDVE